MSLKPSIPTLGIVASVSNAGKTTLITQLIPKLTNRHIRVSVIKHAHHQFDIDHKNKDSYQIREAGAVQTLIASNRRWALMTEMNRTTESTVEADLDTLLQQFNPNYADLILIEGFKYATIPKIEVHRSGLCPQLLANTDKNIIAIASNVKLHTSIPTLDLNDIDEIADFIMLKILKLGPTQS